MDRAYSLNVQVRFCSIPHFLILTDAEHEFKPLDHEERSNSNLYTPHNSFWCILADDVDSPGYTDKQQEYSHKQS